METIHVPAGVDPQVYLKTLIKRPPLESLPIMRGGSGPHANGFSLFDDGLDPNKKWFLPALSKGDGTSFKFVSHGEQLAQIAIPILLRTCGPANGWSIHEIPLRGLEASLVITRPDGSKKKFVQRTLERKKRLPAGPAGGGAGPTVVLRAIAGEKIPVIKVIREHTGASLSVAKEMVDHLPATIASGLDEAVAQKLVRGLQALGATAELTGSGAGAAPIPTGEPIEELIVHFNVEAGLIREIHGKIAFTGEATVELLATYAVLFEAEKPKRVLLQPRAKRIFRRPLGPRIGMRRRLPLGGGLDVLEPEAIEPAEPISPPRAIEAEIPGVYSKQDFMFSERINAGYPCERFPTHYLLDRGQGPTPIGCEPPPDANAAPERFEPIDVIDARVGNVAKLYRSNVRKPVFVVPLHFALEPSRPGESSATVYSTTLATADAMLSAFDFRIAPRLTDADLALIKAAALTDLIRIVVEPAEDQALVWSDPTCPTATLNRRPPLGFLLKLDNVKVLELPLVLDRLAHGSLAGGVRIALDAATIVTAGITLGGTDIHGKLFSLETVRYDLPPLQKTISFQTGMDFASRKIHHLTIDARVTCGGTEAAFPPIILDLDEAEDSGEVSMPYPDVLKPPAFTYAVRATFEDGNETVKGPFTSATWGRILIPKDLFDSG